MKRFFIIYEIPIFKDKRLSNLDIKQQKHRHKIPRSWMREREDDTIFHNREYKPEVGNMNYRVQEANKKEIDAINDQMELYKNHEIYNKLSNPELYAMKEKRK